MKAHDWDPEKCEYSELFRNIYVCLLYPAPCELLAYCPKRWLEEQKNKRKKEETDG